MKHAVFVFFESEVPHIIFLITYFPEMFIISSYFEAEYDSTAYRHSSLSVHLLMDI